MQFFQVKIQTRVVLDFLKFDKCSVLFEMYCLSMYVSKYIYRPLRSFFTRVCHSVHRWGICLIACWETRSRNPLSPGTRSRHPSLVRHPPGQRQTPPRPGADTSPSRPVADDYCCGRYASYWNAFLFSINLQSTFFSNFD